VKQDRLIGVLDLDSPLLARFDAVDGEWLGRIAITWLATSDC
jgi:putative methionine-R-sulfoxide reductase with GAF domain